MPLEYQTFDFEFKFWRKIFCLATLSFLGVGGYDTK